MGKEIEHKFLVDISKVNLKIYPTTRIQQGYLTSHGNTVRIRIEDDVATLTIKSKTVKTTRSEFEYNIPIEDAFEIMKMCEETIYKKRTSIYYRNKLWTVDVFEKENEGLIIAEIELDSEDEKFDIPVWAIEDVSHEDKYFNCNLINNPYKTWK